MSGRAPTYIGHLDADCFYVSAERVRDDFLRGKAVGVLGNQGACVIAKSYEMKAAGVGTGMPIWEAVVKCPEGIYVKRDFRWYEVLSRAMLDLVRDLSGRAEYYSIDEFFFDATPPRGELAESYALRIRDTILETVGVPVTVGIARSRSLAKLISDSAKPFGARAVLDPTAEAALLADRPVTEITGIAGRRERRLAPWGIRTCLDFARADRRLIRELLTSTGEKLWWELNGDPVERIATERPPRKVISRGGSLGEPTASPNVLWAWLVRNLERLIEELEYYEVRTGRVSLWVGYRDGDGRQGAASLDAPTDRFDVLIDVFRPCLRAAWKPRVPATRMHLFAESLVPRAAVQLGLFESLVARDRAEALAILKRQINARHGRFALRSGATLPLTDAYRDDSQSYDICDVHGKTCF